MTLSNKNQQYGASNKHRVELEPGDEGFVSNTYDASTSLRRPRRTLARFIAKCFDVTQEGMKYEV